MGRQPQTIPLIISAALAKSALSDRLRVGEFLKCGYLLTPKCPMALRCMCRPWGSSPRHL